MNLGGAPMGLDQPFAPPAEPWTCRYWGVGELVMNVVTGYVTARRKAAKWIGGGVI